MQSQQVVHTSNRTYSGQRRVVRATASLQGFLRWQTALALSPALPAGEPRIRSPMVIDSASLELGCPRFVSVCRGCLGLFMGTWFNRDAEAFLPASVTLGSPADNTTPRCQRVARGWILPLPKPQTAALGAVGRGGLVGARKRLQSQQHFSASRKF